MQRLPSVIILLLLIVVGVLLALRGLTSDPAGPTNVGAYNVTYFQPRDGRYGAHNFRRPNRVIAEYDDEVAGRLATLVERRSTAADPDLIRLVVDMLDPPSDHMVKMSRQLFSTPQSRAVDKVLNGKVTTRIHH